MFSFKYESILAFNNTLFQSSRLPHKMYGTHFVSHERRVWVFILNNDLLRMSTLMIIPNFINTIYNLSHTSFYNKVVVVWLKKPILSNSLNKSFLSPTNGNNGLLDGPISNPINFSYTIRFAAVPPYLPKIPSALYFHSCSILAATWELYFAPSPPPPCCKMMWERGYI